MSPHTRTISCILALSLGGLPLSACAQERARTPATPREALVAGEYALAASLAEAKLQQAPNDGQAAEIAVRALLDVGKITEALTKARGYLASPALAPSVNLALGDVYRALGARDSAQAAYGRAQRGPDALLARYRAAELQYEAGAVDAAMAEFDTFIDAYNTRKAQLTASDLRAVGLAVRMLGRRDPQLFKDAVKAFDEAARKDSLAIEAEVDLGVLFLDKFNGVEARKTLTAVLARNPKHVRALVAMARSAAFDGESSGAEFLLRAAAVDARDPAVRAQLSLQLTDVERFTEAMTEARRGLATDTLAIQPLTALAAAQYLSGDTLLARRTLATIRARYPVSADAEVALAESVARNRLYREAAKIAAEGAMRDSSNARALALLGINLMRTGDVAGGRAQLERAFARDPYDVWVKNTLDLLDTFKDYTELTSRRFVFAVETKDAELMRHVALPLAEEAFDSLAARYAFTPELPVRVEMFRSHADFSVRTVGLAGLGALGVSFGNVVAMDSPAARKVGEFNWGSTLWHELAHTFTLGASANRIPRWLSEGLSVYEERRARPSWGSDISPNLIAAYKGGHLNPVSKLNDGFVRPKFGEEVTLSYVLASYVCEMIEAEKGVVGLRGMLAAYREGLSTERAIQRVFGVDMREMDSRFDAWFRRRFATEFSAVTPKKSNVKEEGIAWEGPLADAMSAAVEAARGKNWGAAVTALEEAKRLFPRYAGEASAYHLLAQVARDRGDSTAMIAELRALTARNESAFTENLALAAALEARSNRAEALQVLRRTVYITPFDVAVHQRVAALSSAVGDKQGTVAARRALLALDPPDRADAYFQLAQALVDAGDTAGARREVLRALDIAPNFEKAQQLLLSLRRQESNE